MLQVEAAAATTARRSQHRQRDDRPRTKTSSGIPTPSLPCHCPPLQWRRHADDRRLWLRRQSRCACDQRRAAADVVANAAMSSTVLGGGSHSALPSAAVAPMTKGKVWRSLRLAVPATELAAFLRASMVSRPCSSLLASQLISNDMLPLLTSKFVSQHPPLQILTQPHCFVLMHIKWLLYCLDIG
ncbi:unnamed protein product, partial [Urochloa humidicola]